MCQRWAAIFVCAPPATAGCARAFGREEGDFFSTFVRGLTATAKTNVDPAGSGVRGVSKEKRPQTSQRGRIVEGVVKLSSTFSNELSVCVGDAGHGQVFSPKWPSVGVRFGCDCRGVTKTPTRQRKAGWATRRLPRQRLHICQRQANMGRPFQD